MRTLPLLALGFLVAGCSAHRPVIYPDAHARAVGEEQQKRDVEECRAIAKERVSATSGSTAAGAARDTAVGGAIGAAGGAVGGAVYGNPGTGAAAGAASGAVAGFLSRIFRGSPPNPTYMAIVNRCLEERGYEVSGWD